MRQKPWPSEPWWRKPLQFHVGQWWLQGCAGRSITRWGDEHVEEIKDEGLLRLQSTGNTLSLGREREVEAYAAKMLRPGTGRASTSPLRKAAWKIWLMGRHQPGESLRERVDFLTEWRSLLLLLTVRTFLCVVPRPVGAGILMDDWHFQNTPLGEACIQQPSLPLVGFTASEWACLVLQKLQIRVLFMGLSIWVSHGQAFTSTPPPPVMGNRDCGSGEWVTYFLSPN